jgi:hypothetical protein
VPIFPYRKRPALTQLAFLLEGGERVQLEDGRVVPWAECPDTHRVWASWDLVNVLWGDGVGEALCWQNRPVRWRPTRTDGPWKNHHNDVRVMRLPFPEDVDEVVTAFDRWRGWLARYGAAPQGSLGSSAWSLLRATIRYPIYTSVGQVPPIPFIMGGRQALALDKVGRHEPGFHYDLPAAYAAQLGRMRYGGAWAQVSHHYPYQLTAARGVLCFLRATVRIPDMQFGPLPKRPKEPPRGVHSLIGFHNFTYPAGRQVTGVWTWEELTAASEVGCKVRVKDVWILASGDGNYPFMPWWDAVQDGRGLGGFAGTLAKATGNAMWGQFAITPDAERYVIRWSGSRSNPMKFKRPVPLPGKSPHYCPDLAETLTGRVRADLYRAMLRAGSSLLCAHTDGMWTSKRVGELGGSWRPKYTAARVDMVTPQFLRFAYRKGGDYQYVVAGAPDTLAPALFERVWGSLQTEGRVPA